MEHSARSQDCFAAHAHPAGSHATRPSAIILPTIHRTPAAAQPWSYRASRCSIRLLQKPRIIRIMMACIVTRSNLDAARLPSTKVDRPTCATTRSHEAAPEAACSGDRDQGEHARQHAAGLGGVEHVEELAQRQSYINFSRGKWRKYHTCLLVVRPPVGPTIDDAMDDA
jgi:hypothetical protein